MLKNLSSAAVVTCALRVNYLINSFVSFQQDIVDVNTIFKDLAAMVYDQGEDLSKYWQAIDINLPPKMIIEAHQVLTIYLK